MNFNRAIRVVFEGVDIEPITDLRVAFNVDKSDGEQLNRGVITIYNLNPSSRASLSTARPLNTILVEPVIKRSEERRVGKEGRSRWSRDH